MNEERIEKMETHEPEKAAATPTRKDSATARKSSNPVSRKNSNAVQPEGGSSKAQQTIRIIKEDSKASDADSGWSATATSASCSNLLDAQSGKLKSGSASTTMVDIAVRNEEDQPDYVDIDKADDEEEREADTVAPLVTIMPRLPSSEHIRSMQTPTISVAAECGSKCEFR